MSTSGRYLKYEVLQNRVKAQQLEVYNVFL